MLVEAAKDNFRSRPDVLTAICSCPAWRKNFKALLLSYFKLGGMQIQVNGLSAGQLRQAIKEPERHKDLVVRIAGYSARFTSLGRDIQKEMARRFENGL